MILIWSEHRRWRLCLPIEEQKPWEWKIAGSSFCLCNCLATTKTKGIKEALAESLMKWIKYPTNENPTVPCSDDRNGQHICHRLCSACYIWKPAKNNKLNKYKLFMMSKQKEIA